MSRRWDCRRADPDPQSVTVAGERAGAVGDAGDNLEDDGLAVATLAHARCRLGNGPGQRPCPPPDVAAAVTRAVLGGNLQRAVIPVPQ